MWGVDHLTVRFGRREALREVTFSVDPGSVTTVVGGDGAGKTTLCRALVGLVAEAAGEIRRPAQIGYQAETSGVWADLTVAENLDFVAEAHHLAGPERAKRIAELLDVTDLEPAVDRLAKHLSGGMRQKLGVAMALLPHPELLVLDEPTTGLDPLSRAELWRVVERYVSDGTAVIATTAYFDEAERGSQVVALDEGDVLAVGSVADVIASMPGAVAEVASPSLAPHAWRRGPAWRGWYPDGHLPDGVVPVQPDLADVVTVAALRRSAA